MITTLKILGIICIVLLFLAAAAVYLGYKWLRKNLRSAGSTPPTPCRVHPEPEPNPQWRTPGKVTQYASEFRRLGFEDVGAFTIPEMNGLQMLGFVHPQERLYGAIYDHTQIAPTFDICCDFEDKTGLSATNSQMGATLDTRPDHTILWLGDDRVEAVFQAVRNHPQTAPRVAVSPENFVRDFCRNYAESINWRMKKGGVSRDEIRRQAESGGAKLDEEGLEEVYTTMRKQHVEELQRGCLAQYLDENRVPAADWERLRARTFALPETLEGAEVIETLESALSLDQEQRHELGKLRKSPVESATEFMDRILAENVGALGLLKVGEVQEPVRAYVLQVGMQEDSAKALAACA